MVSSSSTLRNVRLSIVVTSAAVISLLFLPLTVFAQLEEEGGGVAVEAEENATATTTTSEAATNETAAAAASPARNNNMTGVQFLFIQHAQSGSVSEVNATTFTLELSDVSDKTIMFSDRPDRIVTSQSTSDFVGNWSQGEDSFAADPPNAVLVLDDEEVEQRQQEIAVIELFNPEYDSEANTLRYDITAENATATSSLMELPSQFVQSTLIIDAGGGGIVSFGFIDGSGEGDGGFGGGGGSFVGQ
jgi:hypothetical protein